MVVTLDGPRIRAASFAMVAVCGLLPAALAAQIPWDESRWEVQAQESRVENYLGREGLFLRGGNAWLKGVDFEDGVIEYDMAATSETGFHGLRFRAVGRFDSEHVYLRPHLSGLPDAVQYNPIFHGISSWQIYADARYVLPATITPERWVHVRVAVQGQRMEMTIDGELLVFPDLIRESASGEVALNSSGAGGVRCANVVVRPGADPEFVGTQGAQGVEPEPGTVSVWRVSEPFVEAEIDGVLELPRSVATTQSWSRLRAGVRGIANIAELTGMVDGRNTVFAAIALDVETARTVRIKLGFSDRARVFLNGRQLFSAADGFATRDYRFLGTMGLYDELFLPLEAGSNELWVAVSETFGGWGISMQLIDGDGVIVG
jgi:hypothetical protein